MKTNVYILGEVANGFIKRVVDDLDYEMVETFFIGRSDVHSRTFSDRF